MTRPSNSTPCDNCGPHLFGEDYVAFDGYLTGCSGYDKNGEHYPCDCKGFMQVYRGETVAVSSYWDR